MSSTSRKHPIDVVEDIWTIIECSECGMLFFNEERLSLHMMELHNLDYFKTECFSIEVIRAIPQDEKSKTESWKENRIE